MKKKRMPNEELTRWLDKKGLSVPDWAISLGLGPMTLYAWVNGTHPREIYIDRIRKINPDCPLVEQYDKAKESEEKKQAAAHVA